jgi:hypothetical protein
MTAYIVWDISDVCSSSEEKKGTSYWITYITISMYIKLHKFIV